MKKITAITINVLFFMHVLLTFLLLFESHIKVPFWLQPVGRMHPLLLHFPVAFIALLVLLQLFKKHIDGTSFNTINWFLLLLTSVSTTIATIMGLLLSMEGYESELMTLHKWMGVAISFIVFGLIFMYKYQKAYKFALFATLIGVTFAGHYGAGLTHGTHFITEPLVAANTPKIDENTAVYMAYIQPVLDAKCVSCHNPQKKKGGLDLSTIAGINKGGDSGALWLAHQPDESLFLQRVYLPLEDKEHMPPEGKPQLTDKEVELIETWIQHGTNDSISYAALQKTDTLQQLIAKKWYKSEKDKKPAYDFDFAKADVIASLNNPYTTVKQKTPKSPAIDVVIHGQAAFKSEYISDLEKIKEQIVYMDLSNLPVKDSDLTPISKFKNLEELVLNFTDITNEGLKVLSSCEKLKSLSLSGTSVNANAVEALKNIKNLKSLFVWNTKIKNKEMSEFKKELSGVEVTQGFKADPKNILPLSPPILVNKGNIIEPGDLIALKHKMPGVKIHYTIDGSKPDKNAPVYDKPFAIELNPKKPQLVKAVAIKKGWKSSKEVKFSFYDRGIKPTDLDVVYQSKLSDYLGETAQILKDNVKASTRANFSKYWAGFDDYPLIAIIDFKDNEKKPKEMILSYGATFRNKNKNAIKKPAIKYVEVLGSSDKENWTPIKKVTTFADLNGNSKTGKIAIKLPKQSYTYYKLVAQPIKGKTFFVDQIFFY